MVRHEFTAELKHYSCHITESHSYRNWNTRTFCHTNNLTLQLTAVWKSDVSQLTLRTVNVPMSSCYLQVHCCFYLFHNSQSIEYVSELYLLSVESGTTPLGSSSSLMAEDSVESSSLGLIIILTMMLSCILLPPQSSSLTVAKDSCAIC